MKETGSQLDESRNSQKRKYVTQNIGLDRVTKIIKR